jgi:hypothetical protein
VDGKDAEFPGGIDSGCRAHPPQRSAEIARNADAFIPFPFAEAFSLEKTIEGRTAATRFPLRRGEFEGFWGFGALLF